MSVKVQRYRLQFKRPATTSRDTLQFKDTWFISQWDGDQLCGIGEASPIFGLNPEDELGYEQSLTAATSAPHAFIENRANWGRFPSMVFGLECFQRSLTRKDPFSLFDRGFYAGHPQAINGLIWMGDAQSMQTQIKEKLAAGFSCIKLKIGALDWDTELRMLSEMRTQFPAKDLEIRVDANGAFSGRAPLEKLQALAALQIHSIEQPIRAGNWSEMAALCANSPLPIALDEELIGVALPGERTALLAQIKPHYLILKPSLLGGWASCEDWVQRADTAGIGWWATSALESNIGLNAIAQWVAGFDNPMPQGLGTGGLYENNIQSPLCILHAQLCHSQNGVWDLSALS